jgi:hypothetical protein
MKRKSKRIVEMVKAGFTDKHIMKELGIKSKASLKKMYFDELVETGKIKAIITAREKRKKQRKPKVLTIGKRGTIAIGKKVLIEEFGFKPGERFSVYKTGRKITFKKVDPDEGTDYPGPMEEEGS